MCGIAGIFHYAEPDRPVDEQLLRRMTRVLAHRGPDGEGIFVDGAVGLGHRRLAIVDPTPTGAQPMTSSEGALPGASTLVYNGEFYDHRRFRDLLEARGHRFRGSSDTETLLNLLRERGPGALADIAGIFSLAFWDSGARRLVLARDALGVKQLYIHDDGRRVLFASEIKALLASGDVARALDPEALNEYLHFHTPLFDRTFFAGIRQLRQGEYVEYGRNGARTRRYWHLGGFEPRRETPAENVEALRGMLERVVRDQLMSDVPVGGFFSGGIDSSAIAAFSRSAGTRLQLFGVHFDQPGVIDERPFQESAARSLGLDLSLTTVSGADFPQELARNLYFQDQPVIGAAMFPMAAVSKLAASRVKVCLGGQAADELFGGYARYALARPTQVVSSWFAGRRALPGASAATGPRTGNRVGGNLVKQLTDWRNLRRLAGLVSDFGDWKQRYFDLFVKTPEERWRGLFADRGLVSRTHAFETFSDTIDRSPAPDPADRILHWDLQTYLPGLFQQDDRMSMANGLESRVPFADPRVVRFAFHTPFERKIRGGATKWVLRQAVSDHIPSEVLNRRKVGFDTPTEHWMRNLHRDFVRDTLSSSKARSRGLLRTAAVTRLVDRPDESLWTDLIWKVLNVEVWANVFLDGARPGHDLEVTRAA